MSQAPWTREEFEEQSHLAVERAARSDTGDGRFLRRYQLKTSQGKWSGIGTTTLTNVENGKPVYAFTLKIVAETLKVPVQTLIQSNDRSGNSAPPAAADWEAAELFDNFIRSVDADSTPITAQQFVQIVRRLSKQVVP